MLYTALYCSCKKSQTTTWDVKKHVNNGINYQPQLVIAGILPSTVWQAFQAIDIQASPQTKSDHHHGKSQKISTWNVYLACEQNADILPQTCQKAWKSGFQSIVIYALKKQTPALTPVRLSSKKEKSSKGKKKLQYLQLAGVQPPTLLRAFACHLVRENGHVNNFQNAHHSA